MTNFAEISRPALEKRQRNDNLYPGNAKAVKFFAQLVKFINKPFRFREGSEKFLENRNILKKQKGLGK